MLDRVVNMLEILNIPGFWIWLWFWICQGSEYTGVTQSSECLWISLDNFWIWLIMSEYARMLNTYSTLLEPVSLRSEFAIFGKCAKMKLHNFRKTLYCRCLRGLWIYLRSWIYQGFEYGSGSRYTRVLNITEFWLYQGSEYIRVLNMPGF